MEKKLSSTAASSCPFSFFSARQEADETCAYSTCGSNVTKMEANWRAKCFSISRLNLPGGVGSVGEGGLLSDPLPLVESTCRWTQV